MDQDLKELERAAQAQPGDAEAVNAYERALLRADREAELWDRYRAKFSLAARFDPPLGQCARCDRPLVHVTDVAEVVAKLAEGCVVVDAGEEELLKRLVADAAVHSGITGEGPCVQRLMPIPRQPIYTNPGPVERMAYTNPAPVPDEIRKTSNPGPVRPEKLPESPLAEEVRKTSNPGPVRPETLEPLDDEPLRGD